MSIYRLNIEDQQQAAADAQVDGKDKVYDNNICEKSLYQNQLADPDVYNIYWNNFYGCSESDELPDLK